MVQLQMMMNRKYVQQVLEASSLYPCKKKQWNDKSCKKDQLVLQRNEGKKKPLTITSTRFKLQCAFYGIGVL